MNLTVTSRIGKKFTLYLPRKIVSSLGIREGDKVRISVEDGKIIIRILKNPLELALHGEKFTRISHEEIEEISLRQQRRYEGST